MSCGKQVKELSYCQVEGTPVDAGTGIYKTLPDCLQYRANLHGDAEAFVFAYLDGERERISWRNLQQKSQSVAQTLIHYGVQRRDIVAIDMPNCPEWLYLMFGIMKAGAIPVGIAFKNKDFSNIIAMLQKLERCSVIVTRHTELDDTWSVLHQYLDELRPDGSVSSKILPYLKYVFVRYGFSSEGIKNENDIHGFLNEDHDSVKLPELNEDDIAFGKQSSGSTGPSKIVMRTHKSFMKAFYRQLNRPNYGGIRVYNDFCFSWAGGFPFSLFTGFTTVIMNNEGLSPEQMCLVPVWIIVDEQCTWIRARPSLLEYLTIHSDGSYNKLIPAQYDERLNQPISCEKDEFLGGHDILCEKCSQNQLLKVKQLANFEPYDEKNYDYEVEAYARHLEKVYRLCLPCEIKVQQELQIQDEAISKRLSYLDHFKSFLDNSLQEENILHSSYTDRRVNKRIVISYTLHGISFLCSVLIIAKEIQLDGDRLWQRYLLCIHPVLLWIDKNVVMLVFFQIVTNLMAKLLLGLNRLHIVDAVSCPVWLLVLLFHMGYFPFVQTGSLYSICCLVLNCITCALCLGMRRKRHNKSNIRMTRMSLDTSNISDSVSSVSPFSSVSQTGSRSHINEHVAPSSSFSTPGRYDDITQPDSSEDKLDEELTQLNDIANEKDDCHSNIEDTTSELNAFSLGEPSNKRPHSESGIFSSVSQSTSNLFHQSVTNNLQSRQFGQGRPLLSPPTFNHSSTPERHRLSPLPKFGLFSTSSSQVQTPSFIDRPSSPLQRSAFIPTQLPSTQRHSFTPERPSSPVVTSFGVPPFSNIPLQSDRLSQCSSTTYRTAKRSYVRPNLDKSKNVQQKSKKHIDMTELSDDDDSLSDMTSISRRCPVDSTSETEVKRKTDSELVPWWRHPGFIGFILGGSVVANVVLVSQITWPNKSS